jgi:hypothetical protein
MSTPRRWLVATFVMAILGAQALMALPPDLFGAWYWPFLDYPMYSRAHHPGEEIRFRKVEGRPCGGGDAIALTQMDLGIQWYALDNLLGQVAEGAGEGGNDPRERLGRLVGELHAGRLCSVQVYSRSIRLGELPEGGAAAVPWQPLGEPIPVALR